jgi:hypothetical protein
MDIKRKRQNGRKNFKIKESWKNQKLEVEKEKILIVLYAQAHNVINSTSTNSFCIWYQCPPR